MKLLRRHDGFTLVEGLMVGMIAAVMAAIFIPLLRMHNLTVSDGTARSLMRSRTGVASAEIARNIRAANRVMASDEAWSLSPALTERDNVLEIVCYNNAGAVIRAYRVDGGMLKESADNVNFTPFKTGADTVKLAAGSGFKLSADRRQATLKLKAFLQYRNTNYTNMAMGEMVQCRN